MLQRKISGIGFQPVVRESTGWKPIPRSESHSNFPHDPIHFFTTPATKLRPLARQTIIDWQRDSLVVAVCSGHGASVMIEKISHQTIGRSASDSDTLAADVLNGDAAQALARAVDELGLRKTDAIVVASREVVEVRTVSIPRIDASELPDVIRFQSQRQLANMGDNWALDYVLLPDEPGQEMHTALVGVIAPSVLNEIEAVCAGAGLTLLHVALRPLEIVRYAIATGKLPAQGVAVLVCLSEQQADLMILNNGGVVQVRSTKLPSEADLIPNTLAGELRRSLMASSSQVGNKAVAKTLIFASSELAERVQETVRPIVGGDLTVVDPADLLPAQLADRDQLARTSANRLAGLAGAVYFGSADQKTKVDFKNPKRRPPPKSRRTMYLLAGAAALLLTLGGLSWWYNTNRELDNELAMIQAEIEGMKESKKIASQKIADLVEIEKFLEASPNWLDELAYVAERLPPSDKVILGEPTFSTLPDGTGRISLPVAADTSPTLSLLDESLRDEDHIVAGRNPVQLDQPLLGKYKWRADGSILIKNRGWDLVSKLDTSRKAGKPQSALKAEKDL